MDQSGLSTWNVTAGRKLGFILSVLPNGSWWWLLVTSKCNATWHPRNQYRQSLYLCFLYQKKSAADRADGTRRLAKFIKHLAKMPQCPYEVVYLRPTGEEMLAKYSPHLQALKYKHTFHSTDQLKTIYERVLKAKKTKMKDGLVEGGYYYRSELFQPTDPKKHKTKFPWPKLLQDSWDTFDQDNLRCPVLSKEKTGDLIQAWPSTRAGF